MRIFKTVTIFVLFCVCIGFWNQSHNRVEKISTLQEKVERRNTTILALKTRNNNLRDALRKVYDKLMRETTWVARALMSESHKPGEWYYLAWVIRNRVESDNYPDTYEEVILEPYQFSAFNPNYPLRHYYTNVDSGEEFERAKQVATRVILAPDSLRPIDSRVRHFLSPVSMERELPEWVYTKKRVTVTGINPNRFTFYKSNG